MREKWLRNCAPERSTSIIPTGIPMHPSAATSNPATARNMPIGEFTSSWRPRGSWGTALPERAIAIDVATLERQTALTSGDVHNDVAHDFSALDDLVRLGDGLKRQTA